MSNPDLPAELLDHTVDLLHNERDALKSCCLVSKSWIPRTRRHLFADVKFYSPASLQAWKNTFPNPSTSPACYTRTLLIGNLGKVIAADAQEGGWIPTFSCVDRLELGIDDPEICLTPFHGFSPAIKAMHIRSTCFPFSNIFDLIRSFPLLEDLSVDAFYGICRDEDFRDQLTATRPSSSPTFAGTLEIFVWGGTHRIISTLLSQLSGLQFRKLDLTREAPTASA